ncbi:replication factor C small subunit, partial [archaeon]|nr:replication factor C small subunit [archaeon]
MTVWTEIYRPKVLKDVIGQEMNITRLQNMVDKKTLTHCIFAGPAGTGKS